MTVTFKIVPKKTKITKTAVAKKSTKVSWKKVSAAQKITKYELSYRVKGAGKWKTQAVSAKKASVVVKKLKSGKVYQVRVRSYKTVSKVKYYSAWSAVKATKKIK
jgi:hypothetical protein